MGRPKVRTDDLRERVLDCAIATLEADGPGAVSARRVASAAGTSTGALYEFFGDKAGLVRAVFFEGFAALRATLSAVPRGDPRRDVVELLAAARGFAVERPMLFEVMYARPFSEFSPDDEHTDDAEAIYRMIVDAVRRWLRACGGSVSAVDAAHVIVAAHRGLVMSEIAGLAGNSKRSVERRYRLGVDVVLDGLVVERKESGCGS